MTEQLLLRFCFPAIREKSDSDDQFRCFAAELNDPFRYWGSWIMMTMMKGIVINIIIVVVVIVIVMIGIGSLDYVMVHWQETIHRSICADMLSFAWRLSTTIDEDWDSDRLYDASREKRDSTVAQQQQQSITKEQQCHWANDDQSIPSTLIHSFVLYLLLLLLCTFSSFKCSRSFYLWIVHCIPVRRRQRSIISGQEQQQQQPISPSFLWWIFKFLSSPLVSF